MATINLATLLVKLKADASQYKREVKGAKDETKKSAKGMTTALKGAAVAGFVVLANAAKKFADESIKEFQTFEAGFSEVMTLLPDLSQEAFDDMQGDLIAFGKEIGRTTDDTIPALYQAISAGIPQENVFDFLETANQAALGGVTTLETAVDSLSSVVKGYGEENITAAQAADQMFTAVKLGKVNFTQLSAGMGEIVAKAKTMNVQFGNVTAAYATMTSQGLPAAQVTTDLKRLFDELNDTSSQTGKIFQELTGTRVKDFIAQGGNLQDVLQILEQHAESTGETIDSLFASSMAAEGALLLTGTATQKFTDDLAAMENATGAAMVASDTMGESLTFLEGQSDAATEALKIQVGEGLEPLKKAYLEAKIAMSSYVAESLSANQVLGLVDKELDELNLDFKEHRQVLDAATLAYEDNNVRLDDGERALQRMNIALGLVQGGYDATTGQLRFMVDEQERANLMFGEGDTVAAAIGSRYAGLMQTEEDLTTTTTALTEAQVFYDAALADGFETTELFEEKLVLQNAHMTEAETIVSNANAANESYFDTIVVGTEALGIHSEALGNYFTTALTATDQTATLDQQMFQLGQDYNLTATELSFLAAATGDYTQEQIEAAFEAAIFEEKLRELIEAVKSGDASIEQASSAANLLGNNLNFSTSEALALASGLNAIPSEVTTTVTTNFVTMGDPRQGGATGGIQQFQEGGFTGAGGLARLHSNEFVLSAPAVRAIGLPELEELNKAAKGGSFGNRNSNTTINVGSSAAGEAMFRASRNMDRMRR